MNEWVASVTPTLLLIIAAAAASRVIAMVVNWGWRKVAKPVLNATLLAEIRVEVTRVSRRLDQEFANGVPPDDDTYEPLRKRMDAAHAKLSDHIETLFEMHGTAHDDVVAVMVKQERHEAWQKKHDELTARQAAGSAP